MPLLLLHLLLAGSPEACGCWQLLGEPELVLRLAEQLPGSVEREVGCRVVRVESGQGEPVILEFQGSRRSVNDVATAAAVLKSWSCPTPSPTTEVVHEPESRAASRLRLRAGGAVGADGLGATWTGVSLGGGVSMGALELSLSGVASWTVNPANVASLYQVGGRDVQGLVGLGWRITFGRLLLTPVVSAGVGQLRSRVTGRWVYEVAIEPRLGLRLEGALDAQVSLDDFGLSVRMAVGPFPQTLAGEDEGPGPGSGWRGRLELALVVGP